jgi:glycosyltransferase involved in cell wall biosynthesis
VKNDLQICVGIHCHEQPEQLHATLASVRRNTTANFKLILLPDGPDPRMRQALRGLSDIPQYDSETPKGTAACFNRMAAVSAADVVVLLESGAQVGPNWLEHLLAALAADSRNGLAGPSTNSSWNEQGVYPQAGSSPKEIERTAAAAAAKFGSEVRTLEPLYSLAEFCYVVRREVIDAVGAADESYGLGPCWEMDYNIRAARTGWRGVWACGAYVHRAPFTARRRREEARNFEASKRRYQDKFCGGRLSRTKTDYREHCRGDACPNFAPSSLIELKRSFAVVASQPQSAPAVPAEITSPITVAADPRVSCIMPTSNRRSFVPQAIRCFLRQDYANLELLVIDDGPQSSRDCVPESERIRYLRLDQKMTLGAKRNFACEQARGEIIIHWDDDDWYAPRRVSTQVSALTSAGADVCGSSQVSYYDPASGQAWEYRYAAPGAAWVAGNTLAYRKSTWQRNKFQNIQVGEDSRFVWNSPNKNICDLRDSRLCVAMVHSSNTSRKDTRGIYWHAQASENVQSLLGDDLHFYRSPDAARASWPLVSCIMPTYNRRAFVPLALEYFLRQDYPNRELIIVDDGDDGIGDLTQNLPNVRYHRLRGRKSIGAKRNFACQQAQGEFIAHWDDDDWYSSDRLRYQMMPLIAGDADITGLENAYVLQLPGGDFWTTKPRLHEQLFVGNVHGGTLVYRKQLLADGLRYPEINLAEDAYLLRYATRRGKRLLRLANPGVFIYIRHGTNAWREFAPGRFLNPAGWQRIEPPPILPAPILDAYKHAAATGKR